MMVSYGKGAVNARRVLLIKHVATYKADSIYDYKYDVEIVFDNGAVHKIDKISRSRYDNLLDCIK